MTIVCITHRVPFVPNGFSRNCLHLIITFSELCPPCKHLWYSLIACTSERSECRPPTKEFAAYIFSTLCTRYRTDHNTVLSAATGAMTTSSKYRIPEFGCVDISSTLFLKTFVTVTFCCPASHNDIKKLLSFPFIVLCDGGSLPTIPSATGLFPHPGYKIQHGAPTRSGPCSDNINIKVSVYAHANT